MLALGDDEVIFLYHTNILVLIVVNEWMIK